MYTDIHQKLVADFGDEFQKADGIIRTLDATTKGTVGNDHIRALIFAAEGNLENLRSMAEGFEYTRIIEENPEIDFSKTFHELDLIKKKKL